MMPRALASRLFATRLLAAVAMLALFRSAFAAEPVEITGPPAHLNIDAPAGWQLLPGLSAKLSATAASSDHFGDEPTTSAVLAYGRANRGALYLTWVDSKLALPGPETTLRKSFDAIHQAPYQASSEAGSTQEVSYRERSFDGLVEMNFEWAHMSNATVNIVRALGWKDIDARVHLAIAECVLPNELVSESRPLCESALASLRLATTGHQPLHALAEPAPAGPNRPDSFDVPVLQTSEELPAPTASSKLQGPPARVGEVLYDGRGKGSKEKSNRIVIAIGVVLLGVAIWLTTRSRASSTDTGTDTGSGTGSGSGSDTGSGSGSDTGSGSGSDTGSGSDGDTGTGSDSDRKQEGQAE